MSGMRPNRRRFIGIMAGMSLAGLSPARTAMPSRHEWRGTALGADAQIIIDGLERSRAQQAVDLTQAEVERLEQVFSLYRPQSELSRLNRDGALRSPSHDFRLLLGQSLDIWGATGGAFNPAIQPLWRFLARHFEASDEPPSQAALAELVECCDFGRIDISARHVTLAPGMALTFNGIAQGYITDRVANLLRAKGLRDILIDLGEMAALPGRSWRIGIEGREAPVSLTASAIATSSGLATPFTSDGRWHHLLDPLSGTSAHHMKRVSVAASTATIADALSTALFVSPPGRHGAILRAFPGALMLAAETT